MPNLMNSGSSHQGRPAFVGGARLGEDHPGDSDDLGGESYNSLVREHARSETIDLTAESVLRPVEMHHDRSSAVYDQRPQIVASSLGDAEHRLLAHL